MKTLARYVAWHGQSGGAECEPARLVPVEVTGLQQGTSELVLVLGHGRRIEVRRGFDADTLRQLITVLEGR